MGTVIISQYTRSRGSRGFEIKNTDDMIKAAEKISSMVDGGILIKGGHLVSTATDLLYKDGEITWFSSERVNNPNTHGTGCTLSSAIACNLAEGYSLEESIANAKKYLTGALKAQLNLGKGSGLWNIHISSKNNSKHKCPLKEDIFFLTLALYMLKWLYYH